MGKPESWHKCACAYVVSLSSGIACRQWCRKFAAGCPVVSVYYGGGAVVERRIFKMSLPQDVVADGAGPFNPSTFAFSEPRLSMTADNMAARSTAMEERLSTFRPIKLATSLQLASAGFSYDEKGDTVKCSLCNLTVDRNGTPDPLGFHKKKSPTCSFFLPAGTKQAYPSSLPMTNAASAASAKVPTPPAAKKTNIPPSGKYPQYKDHPAR